MNDKLQRARLLIQQNRFDLAEQELIGVLSQDPNIAFAHSLLAIVLLEKEQFDLATSEAQQAVHLAPADPFSHYILGRVYLERNHFAEAMVGADQAIALDPYSSSGFGLKGSIALHQRNWQLALDAANQGLAVDPDDTECANIRINALRQLGRGQEAVQSAESLLQKSPDDAFSHCSVGYTALTQGDHRKAREHFRQALMLDPNMEFAREGMAMAIRSRNPVYRFVFKFYDWMGRQKRSLQWGIVIGGYIGYRILSALARGNPDWKPFLQPILYTYIGFALLTWVADPLFNVLLRFDRDGKYLLNRDQVIASNIVGVLAVLSAGCFMSGLVLTVLQAESARTVMMFAALVLTLVVPIAGSFEARPGRDRTILASLTAGAIGFIVLAGVSYLLSLYLLVLLFVLGYAVTVIAFPWVAMGLASTVPRK